MNSPPDPGSPVSTESSGSPPPEEIHTQPPSSGYLANLSSHIQTLTSGASKRRHGGGSGYAGSSSSRDPKSRRRGEPGRQGGGLGASQSIAWETGTRAEGKREERDMVDNHLVDYLRKGDSRELGSWGGPAHACTVFI